MRRRVRVEGGGWAAAACCALLERAGWRVDAAGPSAPSVPFLTLNLAALSVLHDLFPARLAGYQVDRRLVVQRSGEISEVREPTMVISAATALAASWPATSATPSSSPAPWTIHTEHAGGVLIASGSRKVWMFEAAVCRSLAAAACVFEFVPEGWVFWAPLSSQHGFLQFALPHSPRYTADSCRAILQRTTLCRSVRCGEMIRAAVPCAATLSTRLIAERSICCGGAAIRFDPISGDGTATSLRSAILGCAALEEMVGSKDSLQFRNHYAARLALAFRNHLASCELLYGEGDLGPCWRRELLSIQRAIKDSRRLLPGEEWLQFQVRDHALARLG